MRHSFLKAFRIAKELTKTNGIDVFYVANYRFWKMVVNSVLKHLNKLLNMDRNFSSVG